MWSTVWLQLFFLTRDIVLFSLSTAKYFTVTDSVTVQFLVTFALSRETVDDNGKHKLRYKSEPTQIINILLHRQADRIKSKEKVLCCLVLLL